MKPCISHEEALERVISRALPREAVRVPIADAAGCVAAESIASHENFPSFNRAMMDGYAVRLSDAGANLRVTGEIAAGAWTPQMPPIGECLEIMTGAPVPEGCEAVVQFERTRRDGEDVRLPVTIRPGQNIAAEGSECARGQIVIEAGTQITPLIIAALAALGEKEVAVWKRPSMAIITTGDEVTGCETQPSQGKIRDSNGPMLEALAKEAGIWDIRRVHSEDSLDKLAETLEAFSDIDIFVLSGGVSMGKHDLVPIAVKKWGAEEVFHKVWQKPGKPLFFAAKENSLIFGLPGTPMGSHLCFHRYVRAAIRGKMGLPASVDRFIGKLAAPLVYNSDRFLFVPARATWTGEYWEILPAKGKGSSDLFSPVSSNALLHLPEGDARLNVGDTVRFERLKP